MYIRHGCIVLGHAHKVYREKAVLALEAGEFRIDEGTGDFARAIRTEVCKDDGIVCLDLTVLCGDYRNDELVGNLCIIRRLYSGNRIVKIRALAVYHRGIRLDQTLKAVVTIHGIISAVDGRNLSDTDFVQLCLQLLDKVDAGGRRNVTAVHEAVYKHLGQTVLLCQIQQAKDVLDVRVHTAVAEQAEQVQRALSKNGPS